MALLDRFERFLDQVIPAPDEVAAAVRQGEALLAGDDFAGALRVADDALAIAPGFLRALALRTDALLALARPAEALASLDAARRDRALPAPMLARLVELHARAGDEAAALALVGHVRARLRARDPRVARRFLDAARALLAGGHESAGLRLARAATAADPALGEPWLLLGRDALSRGDRGLARRSFERGVGAIEATDASANRVAGDLAWALGDRPAATRLLRRAWIAGDEGAIAPLVAVLAAGDDAAALERVLLDARGELGDVARGLLEVARGRPAPASLLAVHGARVPAVLWHYALDVTLRDAPALAERWCTDAPARPAAAAVRALRAVAGRTLDVSDLPSLDLALSDPTTRPFARDRLRAGLTAAWRGRLGAMLEALAALLRVEQRASAALLDALAARRRELDEPLRVVVLGEFSAGKSTFLNALVGAEVSPMGVLPTTAHVHWLRHGAPGARVIDRRGDVVETSVEDCARAVARRRAAGVEIDRVEVSLPLPALARLELIDTPGFNSGDPAHDDAARRALALADVALWLFDARQAGRHSEAETLAEVAAAGVPIVGVLNKIDQVPEVEREAVRRVLDEGLAGVAPCVAAVSARGALAALREPDPEVAAGRLRESGWVALTAYLDAHLTAARDAWKHARVAGRVRALLDEAHAEREGRDRRHRARVAAARALGDQLPPLREALTHAATTLRREVEVSLRDQLRALGDERAADRDALVADAVAETCWRARERSVAGLRARVGDVERLGVAAGLAPEHAAELLTAPVVLWLDHAAAQGARDATTRSASDGAAPAGDPLAWIEAAADRAARAVDAPDDALSAALDVAREELERYAPPEVRTPAGDAAAPRVTGF
jgi:GTP-binding protein EngB required for normal cell division